MREPRPRHTLHVVSVHSLEIQDLGQTSFHSWLLSKGYDTTNARNNRTSWAREGGWHLKRCRHLETGEDHFWFIAFNGTGDDVFPVKTQQDYRAAFRKLEVDGYAPAVIEQLNTGAAYNLAYSRAMLKHPESATSELKRKSDVNIQGEPSERFVTQRSSAE